jgi:hypothetical protein
MMKKIQSNTILLSIVLTFSYLSAESGKATLFLPEDYTMQTLYIFNFTKYVEWPSGNKAMKIGVVDNASAEEYLKKMAKTKSTGGVEISIVNTREISSLSSCQIIFIPSNTTDLADELIERFNANPILIVTQDADLTKKGASVSFKVVASKLRFQLNEENIKSKGLKVANALSVLAEK